MKFEEALKTGAKAQRICWGRGYVYKNNQGRWMRVNPENGNEHTYMPTYEDEVATDWCLSEHKSIKLQASILYARSIILFVRTQGMMAENLQRDILDKSPVYGEEDFERLIEDSGLLELLSEL